VLTTRPLSLAELTAAPGYTERVTSAIARVPAAADEAQAVQALQAAATELGADAAVFGSFVRDDDAHDSYRFLLACDPVWCAEYERRAWYASDPWLAYALTNAEPVRGHEIPLRSALERDLVELASRYGFRSAVIVPAPASGKVTRLGVLCLGSAHKGFFDDDGYVALRILARALAMELHAWWIERIRREIVDAARLTAEDLQLLAHERAGHCTKVIATRLATSENAVNSRFQRMNARLGVPNRRAAAQLAAEYGLI
jgi:DNA-binding CsgD family transcriptional regulator